MQSIKWYARRLRAMSSKEVGWRVKSSLARGADYILAPRRRKPLPLQKIIHPRSLVAPGFRVSDFPLGQWTSLDGQSAEGHWRDALCGQADQAAAHRLSFFHLINQHLGNPIRWSLDHESGIEAPMRFSPTIDYRNASAAGDCKLVWEPNRHHQLVVLARAYRASGQLRYAEAVVSQLKSWLDHNPYARGMNWRSGLELAIRLINWVWAMDMIEDSGLVQGAFRHRIWDAVIRHVWEIDRNYSRGSSANNHLIGEAAGVYVASSYFHFLLGATRWRRRSRQILIEQLLQQTNEDGGTKEQATGYLLFIAQLFLVAGLVGRNSGRDFPAEYWGRLEKCFEFLGTLSEGGDGPVLFGDCDDGYVLDLGGGKQDLQGWMCAAAIMFDRVDFKAWAGAYSEPACWLLGTDSRQRFELLDGPEPKTKIFSQAFANTGCYLLQCGRIDQPDRISVVFDCGEHGLGNLAAHAHADALSFVLRAFGRDVLIDPGTFDYFSYPKWRQYFRSTRAHNTVEIDGQDQSEIRGLFLWGDCANSRCVKWQPAADGGIVAGEHDGYSRLADPVTHRRELELNGAERVVTIRDELFAARSHDVMVCFHVAAHCAVSQSRHGEYRIDTGAGTLRLKIDPRLTVEKFVGSEELPSGWASRGYHSKEPCTTLWGHSQIEGGICLTCQVEIDTPAKALTLVPAKGSTHRKKVVA